MAATDRSTDALAADLERARFVRVLSRADGDALAASGILARALAERGTPFHASVVPTVGARTARVSESSEPGERTVVVGAHDDDAPALEASERPASALACELVRDLGCRPDPVLAFAGAAAAGVDPGAGETEWLLDAALERELLARREGVAVPTADVVDGLAHATTCRGPWSGDLEATREALEGVALGPDSSADAGSADAAANEDDARGPDHRHIASVVALDVVGSPEASVHAATAIARALRPYETPGGPFETVGGYADVLEATATAAPGVGVALALGHDARDRALEVWREHGRRAHEALSAAKMSRHDGLFVCRIDDGPVETVARLVAAYRSPEPTVLVVGDGAAGVATQEARPLAGGLEAVARDLADDGVAGADYDVGPRRGRITFEPTDGAAETLVAAARGAL